MRDRLTKLLRADVDCTHCTNCEECEYYGSEDDCFNQLSGTMADFLLANQVVVLPVKPRDTVYTISRGKIKEWIVYYVGMNTLGHIMFNFHSKDLQNTRAACEVDIGETVFLTEEDAINELKERKSGEQRN